MSIVILISLIVVVVVQTVSTNKDIQSAQTVSTNKSAQTRSHTNSLFVSKVSTNY